MRAYIVVPVGPGKSRDVARQIASLPGVKVADACWGSRDVFAVVEVAESQELNKLVMDTIQRLGGVAGTNTNIALDSVVFESIPTHRTGSTCPS
jgi:DNA-binding Lrp family transcriptional regulator